MYGGGSSASVLVRASTSFIDLTAQWMYVVKRNNSEIACLLCGKKGGLRIII